MKVSYEEYCLEAKSAFTYEYLNTCTFNVDILPENIPFKFPKVTKRKHRVSSVLGGDLGEVVIEKCPSNVECKGTFVSFFLVLVFMSLARRGGTGPEVLHKVAGLWALSAG